MTPNTNLVDVTPAIGEGWLCDSPFGRSHAAIFTLTDSYGRVGHSCSAHRERLIFDLRRLPEGMPVSSRRENG